MTGYYSIVRPQRTKLEHRYEGNQTNEEEFIHEHSEKKNSK